jgi:hypothetical protein
VKAKRLAYAIGLLALIAAGVYVFVYLYRWEWNRAIMAGVIFIAAEIALIAALILDRLKSIEKKVERRPPTASYEDALRDIQDSAPPPKRHFAWLTDGDKVGVFVPVLMGAGVVMSGIAWCVERLATSTAKPVLERRLAARLAPISLPVGGLTGSGAIAAPLPHESWPVRIRRPVAMLLGAFLVLMGINMLEDLTKNRADTLRGGVSNLVLQIDSKSENLGSNVSVARSLWAACHGTVPNDLQSISRAGSMTVALNVKPAIGEYGMRRLKGCLQDGTLDGVQATVLNTGS